MKTITILQPWACQEDGDKKLVNEIPWAACDSRGADRAEYGFFYSESGEGIVE